MKKTLILGLLVGLILSGCQAPAMPMSESPVEPVTVKAETPAVVKESVPVETIEAMAAESETETAEPETTEPAMPETEESEREPSLADYFPALENSRRTFKGVGIEYASYSVRTEYTDGDRYQFHNNNGGTETVNVFEVSESEVRLVFTESENYSRLDRLAHATPNQERILLQAPLVAGHSWEDPILGVSTILRLDEPIVILGTELVRALVVESEEMINYYALGYGLVKTVYPEHDISSTLDQIEHGLAYPERIDLVHLDESGRPMGTTVTFDIKTNDPLEARLSEALRRPSPEGLGLPAGFEIKRIDKEPFSPAVSVDLGAGIYDIAPEEEPDRLRELALTLSGYFSASDVYFSVEGGDYDSGTLRLDRTEPFEG